MYSELEVFIQRINNFDLLSASEKIPFFVYFLSGATNKSVLPSQVRDCFIALSIQPYSNIASFMAKKSTGKDAIFIRDNKKGYHLTRSAKQDIASKVADIVSITPTNDLIPLSIVKGTRSYIEEIAKQMCCCYDKRLFDACLVMMRKLLELLIIECFERHGASDDIKESNRFYYLSELIPKYLNSPYWNASINLQKNIAKIKTFGDLSAHNRRFIAQKEHIDMIKLEATQVIQEIILTIDYAKWNEELKNKKEV